MKITGTIAYQDLEGGFWGILGDDEVKYCPDALDTAFQVEGLRVQATIEIFDGMSLRMWGTEVDILEIQVLDTP